MSARRWGAALIGWSLFDAWRIEGAVARFNKRLQVEVFMSQTAGAPAGYRGRFADGGASAGAVPSETRAPPFSEQEEQLRDGAARRDSGRQ